MAMTRPAPNRTAALVAVIALALVPTACGGATTEAQPAAAATTPAVPTTEPTTGPTPTSTPAPLADEEAVAEPESVCVSPEHGASLRVTESADRRFRVDLVLDGMGLPGGSFSVLDGGPAGPLASFPDRPDGPAPADAVVEATSDSWGASVVVEVPEGEQWVIEAVVNGEVVQAAEQGGDCREFWTFVTVRTDPVTVG